jgi:hypothetical protein
MSDTRGTGAQVAGFISAFQTPAFNKAKADAEAALALLRKQVDIAAELAAQQDDAARRAYPLTRVADDARGFRDQLFLLAKNPPGRSSKAIYEQSLADIKKATQKAIETIAAARRGLATAEKARQAGLSETDRTERLKTLSADPGGRRVVDEMVAIIGTRPSKTDKAFVVAALQTRFNVTLEAGSTSKELSRIHGLLARVPDGHTRTNEYLGSIKYVLEVKPDESDYHQPTKHMNLRLPSIVGLTRRSGAEDSVTMSYFDFTTLHEIGHSVNPKFPSDAYAGWMKMVPLDFVPILLRDKGFDSIPGYSPAFGEAYLRALLGDEDPEKVPAVTDAFDAAGPAAGIAEDTLLGDPRIPEILQSRTIADKKLRDTKRRDLAKLGSGLDGPAKKVGALVCKMLLEDQGVMPQEAVTQVLTKARPRAGAIPATPDWAMLKRHPGLRWYESISLKAELWKKGDDVAKFAVRGRVYLQSYAGIWNSYDLAARRHKVSDYQFRAPEEWFAELYGMYFMGKLPKNHPHYDWFKNTIDQ